MKLYWEVTITSKHWSRRFEQYTVPEYCCYPPFCWSRFPGFAHLILSTFGVNELILEYATLLWNPSSMIKDCSCKYLLVNLTLHYSNPVWRSCPFCFFILWTCSYRICPHTVCVSNRFLVTSWCKTTCVQVFQVGGAHLRFLDWWIPDNFE